MIAITTNNKTTYQNFLHKIQNLSKASDSLFLPKRKGGVSQKIILKDKQNFWKYKEEKYLRKYISTILYPIFLFWSIDLSILTL